MRRALTLLVPAAAGALAGAVPSQEQHTPEQAEPPRAERRQDPSAGAKEQLEKLLAKEGVRLDEENGIVRARGRITVTGDFLEYVAIGPQGKKHEALITLQCRGSTLKAALIAIGIDDENAKNVDFKPVEPPPTEEEYRRGAPTTLVIEPEGPRLHLAVSWHAADGSKKTYAVEDLILDIRADGPLQGAEWIYFGSIRRPLLKGEPPVFVADYEQNYVSTYYAKPDSHLITIKHARGRFDDNWWPNRDLLPPRGTSCTLILSKEPVVERLPRGVKDGETDAGDEQRSETPRKAAERKDGGRRREARKGP